MTLTLNMTWPVQQSIIVQVDCTEIQIISSRHAARATDNNSDIIINGAFGEENLVHDDVDTYRINCHDDNQLELFLRHNDQVECDTLVIILESPHKDEYENNCIDEPIAPAQGDTGTRFANHLLDIIELCPDLHRNLSVGETRIVLCNPIQFQTSLVAVIDVPDWRKVRDAVWKELWNMQEIKDNFEERLGSYEPDYIINACTSHLQNKISKFLLQCSRFSDSMKYETYHPSMWHRRRRKLTHIT